MKKQVARKTSPRKMYALAKIGLALLFIFVLAGTGVTAWCLFTKGFTIVRLLIILAFMGLSYIGGSCHGYVARKTEELKEHEDEQ